MAEWLREEGFVEPLPDAEQMRRFRWDKVSMVFQGAMNALNPVTTVRAQLRERQREQHRERQPRRLLDVELADAHGRCDRRRRRGL